MTKFKLSSYATRCSFSPPPSHSVLKTTISPFRCWGSTHSSTRVLGRKPSAHRLQVPGPTGGTPTAGQSWRRWARQQTGSTGPGEDGGQGTALQAARRNLGWTPGLQINSWPSAFPFMTQPFLMKGCTVSEEKEARRPGRRHGRGNCGDDEVIEIKVQGQLLEAAAAL